MAPSKLHNTKIVCTLGPSSADRQTIERLVDTGMSVARLNASHGTREDRAALIERVRAVDAETDSPVAVLLDLSGPEIRTAPLDEPIELETGSEVRFSVGDTATPANVGLSVDVTAVEPGDRLLLDDGRIETVVRRVEDDTVVAAVESGGTLGSRKGVNVPGVDLGLDPITEADRRELTLAADHGVDFVAASFVRDAADVYAVNEALEAHGADVPVIAKIERADAVDHLDGIVEAAYGVMVARGDLGVECPLETVPLVQKRIIHRCRDAGVPVITATEMLDSMTHARRPTRAEASDVANAVLDGTDAVMLSGETAVGDHPARVVETMATLVGEIERNDEYAERIEQDIPEPGDSRTDVLARSARYLARDIDATAIVAATESGYTARKAAKYRPDIPIVAVTPSENVRRQLALSAGVRPRFAPLTEQSENADVVIRNAVQTAIDTGVVATGDTVVVLAGLMTALEQANPTNMLKVHVAAEIVASGRPVVSGHATGPLYHSTDGDLTDLPAGAILALPVDFDDEFVGDPSTLAGIVSAHKGVTGYPAIVARELDLPMTSAVALPDDLQDGTTVTLDAERGVVYEGDIPGLSG
ncbi:pyruvate kinase [Halococcus saccharolyticus]|uniref:Pyruvate kinase n=1 Tax=Halococcus saccharolyticus DSM 5350 TaxID=1227455 RepID=M0M9D2_9EURY|nr:pyruvate kinase [Halococcus saccharolyticus]EMA42402.1 pyruvate kinase [Halococcus saccharolyticus DSM 5350]